MLKKFLAAMVVAGGFAGVLPFLVGAAPDAGGIGNVSDTGIASGEAYVAGYGLASAFRAGPQALSQAQLAGTEVAFNRETALKRGGNLMDALSTAGVEEADAYDAIRALTPTLNPRKLKAGQQIRLTFAKDAAAAGGPTLREIAFPTGFGREVAVVKSQTGFAVEEREAAARALYAYAEGVIDDSFYLAAIREGVPAPVVAEMIRLFSFDVDFQRDIWPGTRFELFYQRRLTLAGEAEPGGNILAATLVIRGKPLAFYRHIEPGGPEYYTIEGQSARKMLMKTPIDGARLSGRFGMRKHPILGYSRMHKGLDFAAGTGTPVYAAGTGTVEQAGRNGGYGNYVKIRHNSTYSTGYAHLSRYASGIRPGARVRQGQVIGYVGATGLATGPHLHYEIYVNDGQVNPLSLKFPKERTLTGAELKTFAASAQGYDHKARAIAAFYGGDEGPESLRAALSAIIASP